MTRYAIGLGSNVGDRLAHLERAGAGLGETASIVAVSPLYESAPVGGPDQDPYLNAVVVIDTHLGPRELLDRLHRLEEAAGRERTVRWGPRTLDLDIVTREGEGFTDEALTVPHAQAASREFVLRPLRDIWPEAPVGEGLTATEALSRLERQGVDLLSGRWLPPRPSWPGYALVTGQFVVILVVATVVGLDGRLPGGEVTATAALGALLAMFGLGLAFVAARRLGGRVSPTPVPRPGSQLVVSGPYRYARHPIYGGISLVMVGTSLIVDSLWGVVASLGLLSYLWLKSIYEERQLRMRFAGYRAYREVVTRRMIPFVV